MNSLYELTARLLATENLETALDEVLSSAVELQQADMGSVHIYDPVTGKFRIATQRGFDQELLERFVSPGFDQRSACGRAFHSGIRAIIEDVRLDLRIRRVLALCRKQQVIAPFNRRRLSVAVARCWDYCRLTFASRASSTLKNCGCSICTPARRPISSSRFK